MKLWFEDKGAAEAKYGEMKQWGTSKATDMKELFRGKREFNEARPSTVSDTPHTTHTYIHTHARSPAGTGWVHASPSSPHPDSLAGDVSAWDVGRVTNMGWMFNRCRAFNGK